MPTAQARLTRTRGLHATRSSIRSANGTSSLPERSVARRFFTFPVASCAHVPPPEFQDSDLRRPMVAWFPGASDLRALPWAYVRVRGAAGRGCHLPAWLGIARFARSSYVNRALFGISTAAVVCVNRPRPAPDVTDRRASYSGRSAVPATPNRSRQQARWLLRMRAAATGWCARI
jgi:hypothetical protein